MQSKIVDTAVVLDCLQRVADKIRRESGTIELTNAGYWQLPRTQRFDLSVSPSDPGVGNLLDDVEFIRVANESNEDSELLLDHIVPVLDYFLFKRGYK